MLIMNIIVCFIAILFVCDYCMCKETFLYFAYASNMLAKRLHLNNPSAVYIGTGIIENYRLDFNMYIAYWNGSVSTIVPHPGRQVWGVLWEIDMEDKESLNKQEGVPEGWYFPLNVKVNTTKGTQLIASSYQMVGLPKQECDTLPIERRPSNTYLQVMTLGAVESKLPSDYIGSLFTFPSNGKFANKAIREYLGYPF